MTGHVKFSVPFLILLVLALRTIVGQGAEGVAPNSPQQPTASEQDASRRERLHAALSAAASYLIASQSRDGAWRSDIYSTFKNGDALTSLSLLALMDLPATEERSRAIEKGTQYLANLMLPESAGNSSNGTITYPVYTAAGAVMVAARDKGALQGETLAASLDVLRQHQLAEPLGWQPEDPAYGGWSYSKDLPKKPPAGQPLSPLAEPNLSATIFALDALHAAGCGSADPAVQRALRFVRRCQNYSDDPRQRIAKFDDGGFFFIQDDDTRNKAGRAGVENSGRQRYASYGSSTADGLRALLICGLKPDDFRVSAARQWLDANYSVTQHSGNYQTDREAVRGSPYYYYCRSLGRTNRMLSKVKESHDGDKWRVELADELIRRQRPEGLWINDSVDLREDDPLVATPLAIMALVACQKSADR